LVKSTVHNEFTGSIKYTQSIKIFTFLFEFSPSVELATATSGTSTQSLSWEEQGNNYYTVTMHVAIWSFV